MLLKERHTSSRGCSSSPTSTSSSSPASSPNSCLSYSPPGHHQLSSATRGVRGAFSPARSGSTTIPSSNVHLSWSADYGCNLHYKNNMQTLKNCNWPGGTSICTGLKIEVPDPSQGSGSLSSTPPIRFHIKATSRGVLWSTALGISTLQRFTGVGDGSIFLSSLCACASSCGIVSNLFFSMLVCMLSRVLIASVPSAVGERSA